MLNSLYRCIHSPSSFYFTPATFVRQQSTFKYAKSNLIYSSILRSIYTGLCRNRIFILVFFFGQHFRTSFFVFFKSFVRYCCFFCKSLNLLLLSIFHFVPVWLFQVKIWFQNRRNKWKRQLAAEMEAANMSAQRSPHRMVRVPVLYHDSGVAFPPSSGRPERLPGSSSPPTLSSSLGTLCYPHPYPHMSTLRSLHGAV